MKTEKEINLNYTIYKDYLEVDLRELPFKSKIKFIIGLIFNNKIEIYGKMNLIQK